MEGFDEEDEAQDFAEKAISYPTFDSKESFLWENALWIPAKYSKDGVWNYCNMKVDTGASGVGVPSELVFVGDYEPGPEQVCYAAAKLN